VVLIRWSDYIGRKRVLIGVLVLLCVGTLLCVVATSLPLMVTGRVMQGASNVTFGLSYLIMRERLTAAVFGICCGVLSAVNGGVAGTDALLAGYLVDHFGYRSIFELTMVIGLLAVVLGWKALPADEIDRSDSRRMDWVGAVLIAVVVAGINLFLGNGEYHGWTSTFVLACLTAAVVAFVAFIVVENRVAEPLVAFGIGGSLGFTWAGTIVGEGTRSSYQSALWVAVAIGAVALVTSLILKPRPSAVISHVVPFRKKVRAQDSA
jgi:MFS family permease